MTRTEQTPATQSRADWSFRPDVEGLRAVAVLLVLASHLGWLGGGFVGVDVFFVISGFLITGLLVSELDSAGRVSFAGFYLRRARRILPAAAVVLLVTCVAAQIVFASARARDTVVDSLWAAGFAANVHFAQQGTDYFHSALPPSLVQHYWSLAVEEQFYLFWPALLVIATWVAGRRGLWVAVAALTVASFGWAMQMSAVTPSKAYFATQARAWELGVGACVALAATLLRRLTGRVRIALASLGLIAVGVSAVVVHASDRFPAPAGALPVLAAAAVLAAGVGGCPGGLSSTLLTNPATRYLGRLSYSVYLWHWPVIQFVAVLRPRSSPTFYPLVFGALAACTLATYHFVEVPMRTFAMRRPASSARSSAGGRRRAAAWAAGAALATVALAVAIPTAPPGLPPVQPGVVNTVAEDPHVVVPIDGLSGAVRAAVYRRSFPALSPPLGRVDDSARVREWNGCLNVDAHNVDSCRFAPTVGGTVSNTAVLLGDSIALSWMPALRAALGPAGWAVQSLTYGKCPGPQIAMSDTATDSAFSGKCARHQAWALSQIARIHPAVVIVSSAETSLTRLRSGATGDAAASQWRAATLTLLRHLSFVAHVIVIAPPPAGKSLTECATRFAPPSACVSEPGPLWRAQQRAEESAALSAHRSYLDTHLWFCTANGLCPSFVGDTPVRWDADHLTDAYSRRLGPQFRAVLAV